MAARLESEPRSQLQNARPLERGCDHPKSRGGKVSNGIAELSMVERVLCIQAQLERHVFGDMGVLVQRQVSIPEAWPMEGVASHITKRAQSRKLEGRLAEIPVPVAPRIGNIERLPRILQVIRAAKERELVAGQRGKVGVRDRDGEAGLGRGNTRDPPAT